MTQKVIESLLTPIRSLIMKSRPAYKDYLGEETVEEKKLLVSGEFGSRIETDVKFVEGETYLVSIDGVEQEMGAQNMSPLSADDASTGFTNIDVDHFISVDYNSNTKSLSFLVGTSYVGKVIALYHGETLVADGTIESNEGLYSAYATIHDETFEGFVEGETYTFVVDGGESIPGIYLDYSSLTTFSSYWAIISIPSNGLVYSWDPTETFMTLSISQKVSTTKKLYDTKLLPEDLLPKSVVKQKEFRPVKSMVQEHTEQMDSLYAFSGDINNTANFALDSANAAQTTANAAQTTANAALNSANAAQTTANAAQTTANKCISFVSQSLTESQKSTARENIGAAQDCLEDGKITYQITSFNEIEIENKKILYAEKNLPKGSCTRKRWKFKTKDSYYYISHFKALSCSFHYTDTATSGVIIVYAGGNLSLLKNLSSQDLASIISVSGIDSITIQEDVVFKDTREPFVFLYSENSLFSTDDDSYKTIFIANQTERFLTFSVDTILHYISPSLIDIGDSLEVSSLDRLEIKEQKFLIVNSSTPKSTKRFKITVDDTGALTATEIRYS